MLVVGIPATKWRAIFKREAILRLGARPVKEYSEPSVLSAASMAGNSGKICGIFSLRNGYEHRVFAGTQYEVRVRNPRLSVLISEICV